MTRLIIVLLTAVLGGAAIALALKNDNGYVLIHYAGWSIETSVVTLVAAIVLIVLLCLLLISMIKTGVLLPKTVRERLEARRKRKARDSLLQGLVYLNEGRWQKAETELTRAVSDSTQPMINHLAAAHAAQGQQSLERRDAYLEQAFSDRPVSEVAVLLTQARLQIRQKQMSEALATLTHLHEIVPDNAMVLELLIRVRRHFNDWPALRDLLPAAEKTDLTRGLDWAALCIEIYSQLMEQAPGDDLEHLDSIWHAMPRKYRYESEVLRAYVQGLIHAGAMEEADKIITASLKKGWHPGLVEIYGNINLKDHVTQLSKVESWLKQFGDEPELLHLAGRLCLRNRLWGRARSYLESSLKQREDASVYEDLARLYEKTQEPDQARDSYKQGLALCLNKVPPKKEKRLRSIEPVL